MTSDTNKDYSWIVVWYRDPAYQEVLEYRYPKLPAVLFMDDVVRTALSEMEQTGELFVLPPEGATLYFAVQDLKGYLHKGSIWLQRDQPTTYNFRIDWKALYCHSLLGPGRGEAQSSRYSEQTP
jgi:hypothetical protein